MSVDEAASQPLAGLKQLKQLSSLNVRHPYSYFESWNLYLCSCYA